MLRPVWPETRIVVGCNSASCPETIMRWGGVTGVYPVLGLSRNPPLERSEEKVLAKFRRRLDEELYCGRGQAETVIEGIKPSRFGERRSAHDMQANPLRVYSSIVAGRVFDILRAVFWGRRVLRP